MDGGGVKIPEAEASVGGVQVDSMQQLINQVNYAQNFTLTVSPYVGAPTPWKWGALHGSP